MAYVSLDDRVRANSLQARKAKGVIALEEHSKIDVGEVVARSWVAFVDELCAGWKEVLFRRFAA